METLSRNFELVTFSIFPAFYRASLTLMFNDTVPSLLKKVNILKKQVIHVLTCMQDAEPNDRKIVKLCEYSLKNPLRIPKVCFVFWLTDRLLLCKSTILSLFQAELHYHFMM